MKFIYFVLILFGLMIGWNVFLIERDAKLIKSYDACVKSSEHPDCLYFK